MRQLQFSLELAAAGARLAGRRPDLAKELTALCADHVAHAQELTGLLGRRHPAPAGDTRAALDRITLLTLTARDAAAAACLSATDAREVELFGVLAAALAGHEVILREPRPR